MISGIEAKVHKMREKVDNSVKKERKIKSNFAQQSIAIIREVREKLDEKIEDMDRKKSQIEIVVNKGEGLVNKAKVTVAATVVREA